MLTEQVGLAKMLSRNLKQAVVQTTKLLTCILSLKQICDSQRLRRTWLENEFVGSKIYLPSTSAPKKLNEGFIISLYPPNGVLVAWKGTAAYVEQVDLEDIHFLPSESYVMNPRPHRIVFKIQDSPELAELRTKSMPKGNKWKNNRPSESFRNRLVNALQEASTASSLNETTLKFNLTIQEEEEDVQNAFVKIQSFVVENGLPLEEVVSTPREDDGVEQINVVHDLPNLDQGGPGGLNESIITEFEQSNVPMSEFDKRQNEKKAEESIVFSFPVKTSEQNKATETLPKNNFTNGFESCMEEFFHILQSAISKPNAVEGLKLAQFRATKMENVYDPPPPIDCSTQTFISYIGRKLIREIHIYIAAGLALKLAKTTDQQLRASTISSSPSCYDNSCSNRSDFPTRFI